MSQTPPNTIIDTPGWIRAREDAVPEQGGLTIWLDEAQTVPMFFRKIEAGRFRMGSRGEMGWECPAHWVEIPHDFYIGTFPVTQEQFAVFRKMHMNQFPYQLRNPVDRVNWNESVEFSERVEQNAMSDFSKFEVRLPNEAEWEYACRAGSETEYSNGDGEAALRRIGWFDGNAEGSSHPVGGLEPNEWGVYDMHGNVDEWCEDVWDQNAYRKRSGGWVARSLTKNNAGSDLKAFVSGPFRVVRGGAWSYSPMGCCSASRDGHPIDERDENQGFRLLLVPVPGRGRRENQPESGATSSESGPPGAGSAGTERKA